MTLTKLQRKGGQLVRCMHSVESSATQGRGAHRANFSCQTFVLFVVTNVFILNHNVVYLFLLHVKLIWIAFNDK